MLKMFNLPNLFTAANLLCGIFSIFLCFSGRMDWACYAIYCAALFDFFDGFLARKLKVDGELGKQLDSLADMVTFGVAPGMLVCALLIIQMEGGLLPTTTLSFAELAQVRMSTFFNAIASSGFSKVDFGVFAGLLIPFFSLFRLAKFNIDTRQSDHFIGLPTPANTIFFTAFPLLLMAAYNRGETTGLIFELLQPAVLVSITFVMSLILVLEIPLFSLKFKHFAWKENQMRYVFLGASLLLIPFFFAWSIPIIIILYLILSIIENKRTKNAR